MSGLIIGEENGVFEVRLNRPELHNAFNAELIKEITDVFQSLSERVDLRYIVLSGEGKSFCAGADLNWMKSMAEYSEEENTADALSLARLFQTIQLCPCPVIGKVQGHALGGGLGLVSVCDYVVASPKAKLGFTEVKLGLIAATISPFVVQKIGISQARAFFLSGEKFSAAKAEIIGLVHRVTGDDFEKGYQNVIEEFNNNGPEAMRESKRLAFYISENRGPENLNYTASLIAKRRVSSEGQMGMRALLDKKSPSWRETSK